MRCYKIENVDVFESRAWRSFRDDDALSKAVQGFIEARNQLFMVPENYCAWYSLVRYTVFYLLYLQ